MIRSIKNILVVSLAVAWVAGASAQVVPGLGSLPLYFEATSGQNDGTSSFLARSHDGNVLISPAGARLTLRDHATVQMQFLGASPQAQIHGESELAGKINYLTGNAPVHWRTGLATFARVRIGNLYPGIDEVYYGNQSQLEYDFEVSPGASPETMVMQFKGVEKISISAQGELVLSFAHGEIRQPKPVIYQTVADARRNIAGSYKLVDAQTVAFSVGKYDHHLPLIIDPILNFSAYYPVLNYSTYLSGSVNDVAWAVAVNTNDGSVFVAGNTISPGLATTNAYQKNYQGGKYDGDAFVAKFSQHGTNLVYLTYLGGTYEDLAKAIAVDKSGNAFVGGQTDSPNFPVTGVPGITNHLSGVPDKYTGYYPLDGFVAELDPAGTNLVFSTFLGGNGNDAVYGLAIDGADNVYVTGYTFSTNLPVVNPVPFTLPGSTNHFLSTLAATNTLVNCNAFVAKINSQGTGLGFLTYFGGNNLDVGYGIALDGATNIYIAGYTSSTNFPNTNAFQQYLNLTNNNPLNFSSDAFVAKFAPTPTNLDLLYSSYLGGVYDDEAYSVAADNSGAYVTGWTASTNFYNSSSNVIASFVTNNVTGVIYTTNAFLVKITNSPANGAANIAYSVVFGGDVIDVGNAVAVDPSGNAFVAGFSGSLDFQGTNASGSLHPFTSGYDDVMVAAFNTNCSKVIYAVNFGGTVNDFAYGLAVDSSSTAYVVGQTYSANFPTYNAIHPALISTADSFLSEIAFALKPTLAVASAKTNKVTLSWADDTNVLAYTSSFMVQATTNLATHFWVTLTNLPVLTNNMHVLTLPATNHYQFFRLTN